MLNLLNALYDDNLAETAQVSYGSTEFIRDDLVKSTADLFRVNRSKQNNIITLNKIKKTINLKKGDTEEEALENIKEAIIGCPEII